ncbi:hypothetical protein HOD08_03630 [bacterium]|jgi:hypothetical protein|nr:hypothetical protein [bacterium]
MNSKFRKIVTIAITSASLLSHCTHCFGEQTKEEAAAYVVKNIIEHWSHDFSQQLTKKVDTLPKDYKTAVLDALVTAVIQKSIRIFEPDFEGDLNKKLPELFPQIWHLLKSLIKNRKLTPVEQNVYDAIPGLKTLVQSKCFVSRIKQTAKSFEPYESLGDEEKLGRCIEVHRMFT